MPKYIVLKPFKNLETDEVYEVGQEIELTEKRGSDVVSKLENHGGGFVKEMGPTAAEIEAQEKKAADAIAEKEAAEKKKAEKKSGKDEK